MTGLRDGYDSFLLVWMTIILKITMKGDTIMNRKLIHAISIYSKANPGMPIMLAELRKRLHGMTKAKFDKVVLELEKSGDYLMTKHQRPGELTEQEKSEMVPDGEGGMYYAINSSSGIVLKSPRLGRPPTPEHLRREQFGRSIRLPKWIVVWLRAEGDAGKKIEAALIEKYNLTPPG